MISIKGIVLAGGTGSRLHPLTKVTNKHLLPVYDKPMIYYPIKTLVDSGITDITIVLGGESVGDFIKLLGDGKQLGCNLNYVYQRQSGGIAEALYLTKNIVEGHNIAVILGDNIFEETFEKEVKEFENDYGRCYLFLKEIDHPNRFGVAEIHNDLIVSIEEKPQFPKSSLAVTGLYFYDDAIFKVIETIMEEVGYSERGELEITDVNNCYIKNVNVKYRILDKFWSDAGTFKTLLKSSNFIAQVSTE